jgi:hypothetical protein
MSDDLKRAATNLRSEGWDDEAAAVDAAADRIEELEAELKETQMQLHSEKLLREDLRETTSIRWQEQNRHIKARESLFLFALKLRAKQKVYLKTESEEDLIALKKAEEIFDEIAIPAWDSRERKND